MHTAIGTDLALAAEILRAGGLVAIPTETVYGLAADALDEDAVLRIYEAKQRPRFNPLILHTHSFDAFSRYASDIPVACRSLAEAFCPGPLTFLLPKCDIVPDLVTAGSRRVALRVPDHPLTRDLLQGLDRPLAAPSANPSGYVSPVTARHVLEGLDGRIPYILDGGPCRVASSPPLSPSHPRPSSSTGMALSRPKPSTGSPACPFGNPMTRRWRRPDS